MLEGDKYGGEGKNQGGGIEMGWQAWKTWQY